MKIKYQVDKVKFPAGWIGYEPHVLHYSQCCEEITEYINNYRVQISVYINYETGVFEYVMFETGDTEYCIPNIKYCPFCGNKIKVMREKEISDKTDIDYEKIRISKLKDYEIIKL